MDYFILRFIWFRKFVQIYTLFFAIYYIILKSIVLNHLKLIVIK